MADEEVCLRNTDKVKRRQRRPDRRWFYVAGCLFLLLLFAAFGVLIALLLVVGWQEPRVSTTAGVFDGLFDPDMHLFTFRGVPYALRPVGPQRWKPPVPLTEENKWWTTSTYEANTDPPSCAQFGYGSKTVIGSEDCLYLNIYTPSLDPETPLPVLVYVHDGFLHWGGATLPPASPDGHTAKNLKMVVVTIQYRLNVFGFLATSHSSRKNESLSGNYGLMDVLQALRWISFNIRQFGGDPDKVTAVGAGASGTMLSVLLQSAPVQTGRLVQQAWLSGAAGGALATHAEVAASHRHVFTQCNCTSVACLATLSTSDLLHCFYSDDWVFANGTTDLPMTGVASLPLLVNTGLNETSVPTLNRRVTRDSGQYNLTVFLGVTAQEAGGMPSSLDRADTGRFEGWSAGDMYDHVARRLGSRSAADSVCALYEREANVSVDYMYISMVSDARFVCSTDNLTERLIVSSSHLLPPSGASSRSGPWSGSVSTLTGMKVVQAKARVGSRSSEEVVTGAPPPESKPTISVFRYVIGPAPLLHCTRMTGQHLVDGPLAYSFHGLDLLAVLGGGEGDLQSICAPMPPSHREGLEDEGLWKFRHTVHQWLVSGAVTLPDWRPATAASADGRGTVAVFSQRPTVVEKSRLYNAKKCAFWLEHFADHAWRP